jgi:hypothetical protein
MDDASGKFALVMMRADQVRVHHKRTKHEYVFRVAGSHLDVGNCILPPNQYPCGVGRRLSSQRLSSPGFSL